MGLIRKERECKMQHIDEPLKKYNPVVLRDWKDNSPFPYMDEVPDGKYVKFEDVKKFLKLIAEKVRMS